MESISTVQIFIYITIWFFLGAVKEPIKLLIQEISRLFLKPIDIVVEGLNNGTNGLKELSPITQEINERLWKTSLDLVGDISSGLENVVYPLNDHIVHVVDLISPEEEKRAWRITGDLMQLLFLTLFLYADLSLSFNNLSVTFPGIRVPEFFSSITFPILVSSIGSSIVLGMIVGDLLGLTYFTEWNRVEGGARKIVWAIVLTTLIVSITFSAMIALGRVSVFINVSNQYYMLSVVAQSLSVIPLLLTTALLYRGAFGLLIIWIALVGLLMLVLQILSFVFRIFRTIVSYLGVFSGIIITAITALLSATLVLVLTLSKYTLQITGSIINAATVILILIFNIVAFIPALLWDTTAGKFLSTNNDKKPETKHDDETL